LEFLQWKGSITDSSLTIDKDIVKNIDDSYIMMYGEMDALGRDDGDGEDRYYDSNSNKTGIEDKGGGLPDGERGQT
jgi:hypothetical protein